MSDIYLAKIVKYPGYFISNFKESAQYVTSGFLSLDKSECLDWIKRQKLRGKTKSTRIIKLNWKNVKTAWLASDRRELVIYVDLPGNLWTDHKPVTVGLTIRNAQLSLELEEHAKYFIRTNK